MNSITPTLSRFGLMLLLASLPLSGCYASDVLKWNEEVNLHDGKVIVVQRKEEFTASGFPVQRGGFLKYDQFCYPPMKIIWKSKPDYLPETFDIVEGKAYAKVSISAPEQCMLHGYPPTDALYFRWDGEAWQKIDYKEYPKELRYNLLGSTRGANPEDDVHGLVTIAEKEKRAPNMYFLMRKFPNVTGRNDTPSAGGRCEKNKSVEVQTTSSSEVFLPINLSDCQ